MVVEIRMDMAGSTMLSLTPHSVLQVRKSFTGEARRGGSMVAKSVIVKDAYLRFFTYHNQGCQVITNVKYFLLKNTYRVKHHPTPLLYKNAAKVPF